MPCGQALTISRRHDGYLDPGAALVQKSTGDQRIAAVVATAGDHQHAPSCDAAEEAIDKLSDLPACHLHQLQGLDSEACMSLHIRLAHLCG